MQMTSQIEGLSLIILFMSSFQGWEIQEAGSCLFISVKLCFPKCKKHKDGKKWQIEAEKGIDIDK